MTLKFRIPAIAGALALVMGLVVPGAYAADNSEGDASGYDKLSPITTSADATTKNMTVEVMSSVNTTTDPATDTGWSKSSVVENKTTARWRITVSNTSAKDILNVSVTSSVSGCSLSITKLPASTKRVYTCNSTLNSDAIVNNVSASAPIDPSVTTSKNYTVTDSAQMLPITNISEILDGGMTCPVQYDTNIYDQRASNKNLYTASVATVYKNSPSVATCITAGKGKGSFTPFSATTYGRYMYKISTTYDNPRVWKTSVGGDWEIVPNGALLPANMTTESHVSYARLTCNSDWSGASASTPYTDTVTKNGRSYTLTYTQDDCSSLPQGLKCISSSSNTTAAAVAETTGQTDYSTYGAWITKGVTNPENDSTITVIRNGEPVSVDYAVPNVSYGTFFTTNGFSVPTITTKTGMNRELLKNKAGTPWNDNTTARSDTTLSDSSSSSSNAQNADFVIGNKSATWVKKITATTISKWVSDTAKYWDYPMGEDANSSFTFASRWVSDEDNGQTQLRQKFDIQSNVTSKQTIITGINFNGALESSAQTKTFNTSVTCVSGIGNVKTVRSVNNE